MGRNISIQNYSYTPTLKRILLYQGLRLRSIINGLRLGLHTVPLDKCDYAIVAFSVFFYEVRVFGDF